MEQHPAPLAGSAPPPASSEAPDQTLPRSDSPLPPHLRESVTDVPVTPGISRDTYPSLPTSDDAPPELQSPPSYFPPADRDVTASPEPVDQSGEAPAQAAEPQESGRDILRRMSLAAMGGRRESLSEIRSVNPDLSLSGNIISATFNIPYSLKHRPGADWVSCGLVWVSTDPAYIPTDIGPAPRTVCALRLLLLPFLR